MHMQFFGRLGAQLGYKIRGDWYTATKGDIIKNGGGGLLASYYNNSPSTALKSVYPEHNWELKRFKNPPKRSWRTGDNQKKFFDSLMIQLGYNCMEDWYNVTEEDIHKNGGGSLLNHYYRSSPSR